MDKAPIYHVEIHNFIPPDGDQEQKESQENFKRHIIWYICMSHSLWIIVFDS